jgi:hypothetical protein
MPAYKNTLRSRPISEDQLDHITEEIPGALLEALFAPESRRHKLPIAVIIEDHGILIYQVCKDIQIDDLNELDQLTSCVARTEELHGSLANQIHKVILARRCSDDICGQAEKRQIHVLTEHELIKRGKVSNQ